MPFLSYHWIALAINHRFPFRYTRKGHSVRPLPKRRVWFRGLCVGDIRMSIFFHTCRRWCGSIRHACTYHGPRANWKRTKTNRRQSRNSNVHAEHHRIRIAVFGWGGAHLVLRQFSTPKNYLNHVAPRHIHIQIRARAGDAVTRRGSFMTGAEMPASNSWSSRWIAGFGVEHHSVFLVHIFSCSIAISRFSRIARRSVCWWCDRSLGLSAWPTTIHCCMIICLPELLNSHNNEWPTSASSWPPSTSAHCQLPTADCRYDLCFTLFHFFPPSQQKWWWFLSFSSSFRSVSNRISICVAS